MKYIVFFILLFSLIYLNYNTKENFDHDTYGCHTINQEQECKTHPCIWDDSNDESPPCKTCMNINDKDNCEKHDCIWDGTCKSPQLNKYGNIRTFDYNKYAILHNIPTENQDLIPYASTGITCQFNSQCNENEICGTDNGECPDCEVDKCYKKLETKKMYNLNGDTSYIEIKDVDNLNISFKFDIIASGANNNQMIVKSGIGLWYIYINDRTFTLYRKNMDYIPLNKSLNNTDELYTFKIIVTNNNIKININGTAKTYPFYTDDKSILDCKQKKYCGSGGKCKDIMGEKICKYKELNPLYFGGDNGGDNSGSTQDNYKGYIGGFTFYNENNKICEFKNIKGIKSECEASCKNANCSIKDCKDECKDLPICNFDSSKNISRHSIDCMTKCIHPDTECDVNYCKKQCWDCGSNCYWINNNKFSNEFDDKTGKPYPPKIKLHSTSYDGTKAKFIWEPPNPGDAPIQGYFSLVYKTNKKSEGYKIDKINIGLCSKYCEYVISNLIPTEDYSLVVKAYNNIGVGRSSNTVPFKTVKKLINTDVLNKIEDISQYEVGNYSNDDFCNL